MLFAQQQLFSYNSAFLKDQCSDLLFFLFVPLLPASLLPAIKSVISGMPTIRSCKPLSSAVSIRHTTPCSTACSLSKLNIYTLVSLNKSKSDAILFSTPQQLLPLLSFRMLKHLQPKLICPTLTTLRLITQCRLLRKLPHAGFQQSARASLEVADVT